MELFPYFTLLYSAGFLALVWLRRASWLAIGAACAFAVMVVLVRWMNDSSGDAGMGALFVCFAVGLGFLAGGAARTLLLLLGRLRGPSSRRSKIVALSFYFGAPLSLWTLARALG